jgi:hypothetical protein
MRTTCKRMLKPNHQMTHSRVSLSVDPLNTCEENQFDLFNGNVFVHDFLIDKTWLSIRHGYR